MAVITADQVKVDLRKVVDLHPNKVNPLSVDGGCTYQALDDPEDRCVAGELLHLWGLPVPGHHDGRSIGVLIHDEFMSLFSEAAITVLCRAQGVFDADAPDPHDYLDTRASRPWSESLARLEREWEAKR